MTVPEKVQHVIDMLGYMYYLTSHKSFLKKEMSEKFIPVEGKEKQFIWFPRYNYISQEKKKLSPRLSCN